MKEVDVSRIQFNTIRSMGGLLSNGLTVRSFVLDDSTHGLTTISTTRQEIHDGHAFCANIVDTNMGDEATLILAFKTPNSTKMPHPIISWSSKAEAHIELLEAPTWTGGSGSQYSLYNRRRDSSIQSILLENTTGVFIASNKLVKDPTGLTGGSVLWRGYNWGDKKTPTIPNRDEEEWSLKPNTQYAVRLTADAITNAGFFCVVWFEHLPLD